MTSHLHQNAKYSVVFSILEIKASIRRKQSCLRRRALQAPAGSAPVVIGSKSSPALTCSQSYAFVQQGKDDAKAAKNIRSLEFTCDFMERMCQRLISYLCVSQLETLSHDVAQQLANVVEGKFFRNSSNVGYIAQRVGCYEQGLTYFIPLAHAGTTFESHS